MLKGDGEAATGNGTLYLDIVERSLRAAGIPVVNLIHLYRSKAQELYRENSCIYWRDDTHWNAQAVDLAAEEIARRELAAPGG